MQFRKESMRFYKYLMNGIKNKKINFMRVQCEND